jgi:iron complex outermembrane receptor protein
LTASLVLTALASPAIAQQATTAADDEDAGEIVVTARRASERLIDVPATVSVITAETLAATGTFRSQELLQLTPGVTIVSGTAEAGDTQINIRGLNGARDAESSVALVVDGILKTNTAQLNQVQGTLRQVEVLKGPQGALYGRNAAAGAIVMSTIMPGDAWSGAVRANYGELGSAQAFAHIAGPVTDTIGVVLSANYQTTDGFWRNEFLNTAKVVDDQENYGFDGRVIAKLGDATTLDIKGRHARLSGASINFNASFHLPNFAAVNPAFYENVNERPFRYYSNIRPTNEQTTWETSARLEHDFGTGKLTGWLLYSDVDQSLTADGTSADFARYTFPGATPASVAASNSCFATTAALTGYPLAPPTFIGEVPVPFIFDPATGSTFGAYSPTTCDGTQLQTRKQKDVSGEIRYASMLDGPIKPDHSPGEKDKSTTCPRSTGKPRKNPAASMRLRPSSCTVFSDKAPPPAAITNPAASACRMVPGAPCASTGPASWIFNTRPPSTANAPGHGAMARTRSASASAGSRQSRNPSVLRNFEACVARSSHCGILGATPSSIIPSALTKHGAASSARRS